MWALAKLGYGRQAWYADCVEAVLRPRFNTAAMPQSWSNLWWALAEARHRPSNAPLLLARTADALAALRVQTEAQHCSNMLWSLATLGLYKRRLVGCLLGRPMELRASRSIGEQELSNSLWAAAVMGPEALSDRMGEVGALLREVAGRWRDPAARTALVTAEHLNQLWQAQVELQAHPAPEVRALADGCCGRLEAGSGYRRRCSRRPARAVYLTTLQPGACAGRCWLCCRGCRAGT